MGTINNSPIDHTHSSSISTNAQNDALLHRLVHTKLLSGSLNAELDLTPSQRRKALAGRVLEAAGQVKLGKGETAVRAKERNKAAKHVRDGLIAKQKQRNEKALEEVCGAKDGTKLLTDDLRLLGKKHGQLSSDAQKTVRRSIGI